MELNEELEATISSSNALMSTSAVLRAGGLVVGNIPMGASGSERGSKMALSEGAKTFAGSGRIRRRTSGKYKVQYYNCERSSQYNTRQFQCNSCPAGSLFKFSLTVHRTAVSHGGRPGQVFLRGTCPSFFFHI